MDFPITDLLDEELSVAWLMKHFHPDGLKCPHCQAEHQEARYFRTNVGSGLAVYRCQQCDGIYHLYSGTLFEGSQLTPSQVVLLLRGVVQGQSSAQLSRELDLAYKTVLKWRHRLQEPTFGVRVRHTESGLSSCSSACRTASTVNASPRATASA